MTLAPRVNLDLDESLAMRRDTYHLQHCALLSTFVPVLLELKEPLTGDKKNFNFTVQWKAFSLI